MDNELNIFKKIYIENVQKTCYSIRHIKGHYQYWVDNKMNIDDNNGSYIKETIIHNIGLIYMEVNIFEDYKNDLDLFMKNQEYIMNMSNQKYKDKFFKSILKIIDINNKL